MLRERIVRKDKFKNNIKDLKMRVYNGTKAQVDIPLTGTQRIQIASYSVSGDFLPNTEFLSLLVSSFDYSELALVVSGPYEINMCSQVSGAVGFVVNSVEEALARFAPKTTTEPVKVVVEQSEEKVVEEVKEEEVVAEEPITEVTPEEPTVVEEVEEKPEPVKVKKAKKAKKEA